MDLDAIQFLFDFFNLVWDFLMGYKMPIINISYGAFLLAGMFISLGIWLLTGTSSGSIRGGNSAAAQRKHKKED